MDFTFISKTALFRGCREKDIKQMEKGTDIFNSIIMRKEAGMAVLRVQ